MDVLSAKQLLKLAANDTGGAKKHRNKRGRATQSHGRRLFESLRRTMDQIAELERGSMPDEDDLDMCNVPEDIDRLLTRARVAKHRAFRHRDSDETRAEYLKRTRAKDRTVLLSRLCPERKCGFCSQVKLKSRSWIVVSQEAFLGVLQRVHDGKTSLNDYILLKKAGVCCTSCWRTLFADAPRIACSQEAQEAQ